jgi:predicted  nucleic acid-binding Zn-ribbon protein
MTMTRELEDMILRLQAEIDALKREVEIWRDRWADERRDHEATIEHAEKQMREIENQINWRQRGY